MLFRNYDCVLLDAAVYAHEFSQEIRDGLVSKRPIYISPCYYHELTVFRSQLPEEQVKILDSNCNFIGNCLTVRIPPSDIYDNKLNARYCDGLLKFAVHIHLKGESAVTVTANRLLIQSIILNGLNVDIYDLSAEEFIRHEDFGRLRARYECGPAEEGVNKGLRSYKTLYTMQGMAVTPEEVTFYRSGDYRTVPVTGFGGYTAKIFAEGLFTAEKHKKYLALIENKDRLGKLTFADLPINILYADEARTKPVGLIGRWDTSNVKLTDDSLFRGAVRSDDKRTVGDVIHIAMELVKKIITLSSLGIYFPGLSPEDIYFLDGKLRIRTDRFGYMGFCEARKGGDTASALIKSSCAGLYSTVFGILSLGRQLSAESLDDKTVRKIIPFVIRKHFSDYLKGRRPVCPLGLLGALSGPDHTVAGKTYVSIIRAAENAVRKKAPSPAPAAVRRETKNGSGSEDLSVGWTLLITFELLMCLAVWSGVIAAAFDSNEGTDADAQAAAQECVVSEEEVRTADDCGSRSGFCPDLPSELF